MKILLCLYTCEADGHFLEALWRTPLMEHVQSDPRYRILQVHADQRQPGSAVVGDRLVVHCPESYTHLSIKTHLMIEAALSLEFDFLLKLDVTIADYAARPHRKPQGLAARLTPAAVLSRITKPEFFDVPYNGLATQSASRQGVESWAQNKGLKVDYGAVFPAGERTPEYFLGKFYSLRRDFCRFIARHGSGLAIQHHRYLGGSEDLFVGRLYSLWNNS